MSEGRPKAGERGRAITTLSPSGKVLVNGVEYNARLKSGFAECGDEVVVVGFDAFSLVVGKVDSSATK